MSDIIIFEGPDRCGKTEMARALASRLDMDYFKVQTERENWNKNTFHNSLWFDFTLPQFLQQTDMSVVIDRSFPSEWVYSRVFGRDRDDALMSRTDAEFANLDALIILALRRDYKGCEDDDLVARDKFEKIHEEYLKFEEWTHCRTLKIYVDELGCSLEREIPFLLERLK